ncbi:MAG: ATP-binding protein [Verrucomicrobiota bacterium]
MSLHSFRLKIALLSGLITGLLLVGTGVVLWRISYQFNLSRLDREILDLGQGNLDREYGPVHYQRFEGALAFILGQDPPRSILTLVRDQQDKVIFVSPHWPTNLSAASFSALRSPLLPQSGPPGRAVMGPPQWPPPQQPRGGPPPWPDGPPPEWPPPQPPSGEQFSGRERPPLPRRAPRFETRAVDGQSWRFGIMGNPYTTLVLGMNIEQFNADMRRLRRACLLGLPAMLLLAGLSAWFLAQRALRPVAVLARAAERVTARGLDQRIPAMVRDQEFNRLITVFNEMMDRLEKSFQQATRFSADAAHELKSPLARLQVELEQALESAPSGSPQQEVYGSLLDEISRLKAIVQKLLLLSLADAGRLQIHGGPVNLTRMLENVIEDCQAQAPTLRVEQELAANVQIIADADLLEQALQNLASNAVKYNEPMGRIGFGLAQDGDRVRLRVANTGPGIPPADRKRVFERFYRADKSRSRGVEGVGLGLSLCREILRAHGGDLELDLAGEPLTVFAAWLPATCESSAANRINRSATDTCTAPTY